MARNFELFVKDVELVFLQHNVDLKQSTLSSSKGFSLADSQKESERAQKHLLERVLEVMGDILREKTQVHQMRSNFEGSLAQAQTDNLEKIESLTNKLREQAREFQDM